VIAPEARVGDGVRHLGLRPSGYWTPSAAIIETLESRLRAALELGQRAPESIVSRLKDDPSRRDYVAREIGTVIAGLATCRRQYVGVVMEDGAKRVLVSGFPPAENATSDDFAYWRQGIVWVMDGGASFWQIQYNVEDGSFTEFDSNGYA
jgi:hypothetical protein